MSRPLRYVHSLHRPKWTFVVGGELIGSAGRLGVCAGHICSIRFNDFAGDELNDVRTPAIANSDHHAIVCSRANDGSHSRRGSRVHIDRCWLRLTRNLENLANVFGVRPQGIEDRSDRPCCEIPSPPRVDRRQGIGHAANPGSQERRCLPDRAVSGTTSDRQNHAPARPDGRD